MLSLLNQYILLQEMQKLMAEIEVYFVDLITIV